VSWQKYAVVTTFPLILLGLTACAGTSRTYRDTTELEQPPELGIIGTASEQQTDSKPDGEGQHKGLEGLVSLEDDTQLIVNRPFDVAWGVIEKGLLLSGMVISDRNLEKGLYYVEFDADDEKPQKEGNLFTDFFKSNDYPKGRYLLTFYESPKSVKVKVEFLEYIESGKGDSAQDGYAARTPSDNGVEKLLKKLYSALHDDLSVD
jgi:NlpB/DapX lipoprotein